MACIRRLAMHIVFSAAVAAIALAAAATAPPAHAQEDTDTAFCHLIESGGDVSAGFGVPYDVLSPGGELLIRAMCDPSAGAATIDIGASETDEMHYIYRYGYHSVTRDDDDVSHVGSSTGIRWVKTELTGEELLGDSWYRGTAQATVSGMPTGSETTFVAYICTWTGSPDDGGNGWKCGCKAEACNGQADPKTGNMWQMQKISMPDEPLDDDPSDAGHEVNHTFEGEAEESGTHTLNGTIVKPTPCHELSHEITIAESYPEQVHVAFTVAAPNAGGGVGCAQVLSPEDFEISFQAHQRASIRVTVDGAELTFDRDDAVQQSIACHHFTRGTPFAEGWFGNAGRPYSIFTDAQELLIAASCAPGSDTATITLGSSAQHAIADTVYIWRHRDQEYVKKISLSDAHPSRPTYTSDDHTFLIGPIDITLEDVPAADAYDDYVVTAWICEWIGDGEPPYGEQHPDWKCGCTDPSCANESNFTSQRVMQPKVDAEGNVRAAFVEDEWVGKIIEVGEVCDGASAPCRVRVDDVWITLDRGNGAEAEGQTLDKEGEPYQFSEDDLGRVVEVRAGEADDGMLTLYGSEEYHIQLIDSCEWNEC